MINQAAIESMEREIKNYYRRMIEIDRLKNKLGILETRKVTVENDIKNSNINLDPDLHGGSPDGNGIRASGPAASQQEKALDSAFIKLEKELRHINNEILGVKSDIRALEYENFDIEFALNKLDDVSRQFVNLKYNKLLGNAKISDSLPLSESTVYRLRIKVLTDITGYIMFASKK